MRVVQTAMQTAFVPHDQARDKMAYDPQIARVLFEETFSQCHELSEVDNAPPATVTETQGLIARVIENGLYLEEPEIEVIVRCRFTSSKKNGASEFTFAGAVSLGTAIAGGYSLEKLSALTLKRIWPLDVIVRIGKGRGPTLPRVRMS